MQRLGRNRDGYAGETIDIDRVLRETLASARRDSWAISHLDVPRERPIPILTRAPRVVSSWAPRIYLSAGIHGDEPAGPLAVRGLLDSKAFPDSAWVWLCPCLNPTGFPGNTRASAAGHDLNRDYRHRRTDEIRAHVAWLERQPAFDLAFCLHEDWEAAGFYVYELNPDDRPSLAPGMLDAVRGVCPVDLSPTIDGREARDGLIRPSLDPATRAEWPEAFYLLQNKTRSSYTLEAPSDFALAVRTEALVRAVAAALAVFSRHYPPIADPLGSTDDIAHGAGTLPPSPPR